MQLALVSTVHRDGDTEATNNFGLTIAGFDGTNYNIVNVDSDGALQTSAVQTKVEGEIAGSAFTSAFVSLLTAPIDVDGYDRLVIGLDFDANAGTTNVLEIKCGLDAAVPYVYPIAATSLSTTGASALTVANGIISIVADADQFIIIDIDLKGFTHMDFLGKYTGGTGSDINDGFYILTKK